MNTRFDAEFDDYYRTCLAELKKRPNFTQAFIPQLERFVTITAKLSKLNTKLVDEEITHEHTNVAGKTNRVSNPELRMFLELNREANALAKELELSPATAPVIEVKKGKENRFDLTSKPMKVA